MTYDIFNSIKELKKAIGEDSLWCQKKIEIGYSYNPIVEGRQSDITSFVFVGRKPSKIECKTSIIKQRLSCYGESNKKFIVNEFSLMVTVKGRVYAITKINDSIEKNSLILAYTHFVPEVNKILKIHAIYAKNEELLNFKMFSYEKKMVEVKDLVKFTDNIFVIKTSTDEIFLIKKI